MAMTPMVTWQEAVPDSADDGRGDAGRAEVSGGGVENGRYAGHAVVPAVLVHRPLEALQGRGSHQPVCQPGSQ